MKTIGIIAEYNPFHNGHAYQIAQIREQTGADYIVVAMSGDFVQRGTPAIIDKYARTKMALSCGADLVFELPTLWATASAESFAMAGVTLFEKMGCVDGICFGAETDDLPLLSMIAEILADEPKKYQNALATYLRKGINFPSARANALCDYLSGISSIEHASINNRMIAYDADALRCLLNEPNNILAIEYLKAIKKRGSSLIPYLIRREGANYHETEILTIDACADRTSRADAVCRAPVASATAIRNMLAEHLCLNPVSAMDLGSASITDEVLKSARKSLSYAMPDSATGILTEYLTHNPALWEDDFSSILGYLLLFRSATELASIADSNEEIANRLKRHRCQFVRFTDFCALNKSRDITYTRMSRILLHLILDIAGSDYEKGKALDYIPYLRILGFRRNSSALLSEIKKCASVPLISKLANAADVLKPDVMWMLKKDIFAADLYEQTASQKIKRATSRSEYTREIVLL